MCLTPATVLQSFQTQLFPLGQVLEGQAGVLGVYLDPLFLPCNSRNFAPPAVILAERISAVTVGENRGEKNILTRIQKRPDFNEIYDVCLLCLK